MAVSEEFGRFAIVKGGERILSVRRQNQTTDCELILKLKDKAMVVDSVSI